MARRRQRIIEAATAVLTERGPAALPLDEIAERAGVSRRTVFNYFHSVEDLLVAVGADMLGGVIASLQVNAPAPSEVPDPHEAPPEAPQEALLDELAAGLNPTELDWIAGEIKALAQSGLAIIVVEHLMGFIEQITDRVIVMNAGKAIFEGTLAVAVTVPEVVEVFLGGEHAA